MTKFRWLVSFLMLLAASAAYGNQLEFEFLDQVPEFDVLAGEPVSYKFRNTNVLNYEGEGVSTEKIGTGLRIFVDGQLKRPDSLIFSSSFKTGNLPDCKEDPDPEFSDWWACDDLDETGDSQEYSFTWTPPGVGTYALVFRSICQALPIPPGGHENCAEVIRSVTTVVNLDTDGDGVGDPTDPDDDNDGIPDDLDEQPLVPSNDCTDGNFDNATMAEDVTGDLTCAARVSIQVEGTTEVWGSVSPPAHLRLIAPTIRFEDGFAVQQGGLLSVISANPCPDCGGYEIGDEGPGGGIVFYVTDGGWHGLEAAREDRGQAVWCPHSEDVEGVDNISDAATPDSNSGAHNTLRIVEQCGLSTAAGLAFTYEWPNGQWDGFLPNKEELDLMYQNRRTIGGFASDIYWSSSEDSVNFAWYQVFDDGIQFHFYKYYTHRVRAVRAF